MRNITFIKNGFSFKAVQCLKCNNRIIHPDDEQEYNKYIELRKKSFHVKLRMVGNSYTVSIPREIINFINEQNRIMDEIVSLSLDRMGKLSLMFNNEDNENGREEN